ncbi:hypothetical protein A2973_02695 [Candidatus Gottesmanbacteria bacterium RIFCSPLOWO2_01_FULL_49_10]|uniref:Integral membrane protein n=1 Tax=Candidatus Gottesmanbacteria bacterium RIFCSPLOWO2_01_FULL_49_10 TaxID=1798396 RepID=A0A1F6B2N8_9BACT|nr:MAG: hypothetical protein UY10_C0004G0029 [Microgenomates group bacterium GW2011_GWA2_47_8]OGG30807.1 MAG: hypothetical protein A2973_02695 [Candidatus Gottesmanbacteria bacterium RIFCSPLOWO2_01_FULL_49_10]
MNILPVLEKVYAQAGSVVGTIDPGPAFKPYGDVTTPGGGFVLFFSNVLRLVFVGAGVYALLNLVVAGFQYMSAAGDTKALNAAWARIWQSLLGLVIIVGSFALAAMFGFIIFGDASFILNPKVYGPK